eukprot:471743-Pelagomonas_calceolata.AAC.2
MAAAMSVAGRSGATCHTEQRANEDYLMCHSTSQRTNDKRDAKYLKAHCNPLRNEKHQAHRA